MPSTKGHHQSRDERDGYRSDRYDEDRHDRNHHRRLTYEDPDVAARGFGIRSGSMDRYAREPSVDRAPGYGIPAADAVPIPLPRDYLQADPAAQPIPPPPARDTRDSRRDDRVDRERDRDREYRDKGRDYKDRDRERPRDRDRDRDNYYPREDRSRKDRDRDDREGRTSSFTGAAAAGTAAAAAAAYGLHKRDERWDDRRDDRRDERREDRRDDRRYEEDPRAPPEDRRGPPENSRAPPIPPPPDNRPPFEERKASNDDRRAPPIPSADNYPPALPPPENRAIPPLDDRRDERRAPAVAPMPVPEDFRPGPPSEDRGRPQPKQQLTSDSLEYTPRERHYVDKDADRDAPVARQESKKSEALDPDEDYRRRVQAAQADLQRNSGRVPPPTKEKDSSDSDRERRRKDYGREHERANGTTAIAQPPAPPGAYPVATPVQQPDDRDYRGRDSSGRGPPQSERTDSNLFGQPLVQDPEEYADKEDHERDNRIKIVAPPKESPPPPKGILRKPTEKFPEDPNPIREGVAPLKDSKKGKDIPPNARWTKIDRRMVNPDALKEAKERFEERLDCVIVLRVLSKEDIQKLADRTRELRARREEEDRDDYYRDRDRDYDRPRRHRRRRRRTRDDDNETDDTESYDDDYESERERDRDRRDRDNEKPRQIEPAPSSNQLPQVQRREDYERAR